MQNGYYYFLDNLIPKQILALNNQVKQLQGENGAGLEIAQQALQDAKGQLQAFKDAKIIRPSVLVTDKLSLSLGGQQVDIIFPGTGHSDDNIVVLFPQQKVLHAGDLVFNGDFPYIISGPGGADTASWIGIVKDLAKWDITTVVPGHGEIGSKEILHKQAQFLTDLRNAVSLSIKKGQSLEQAEKSIRLTQYDSYSCKDTLLMDIEAVYKELMESKEQGGK
jgi:glyoxylase-like metal-dependent hydrolase (beta-lactamase superfamily II)